MNCPNCNHKSKIYDTRKMTGYTRRRCECLKCGYRFTTFETLVNPAETSIPLKLLYGILWHGGVNDFDFKLSVGKAVLICRQLLTDMLTPHQQEEGIKSAFSYLKKETRK